MKKQKSKNKGGKILAVIVLIIVFIFLLFPLYWMILTSFKTNMEAFRFPPTFTIKNPTIQSYKSLFTVNNDFFTYYINNFIISGLVTVLTLFVSILAGYALSRYNFKWNKFLIAAITAAQMFPVVSRLISLYGIMSRAQLIDTRAGLTFALTATLAPFSAMLMTSFFDGIPREVEEAAYVDGAGRLRSFVNIALPLTGSGIFACGIYTFLQAWDDYLHAVTLIQTDELRTLSAGIALRYLGELSYDWSLINTISIIGTLPMLLIFFFFNKYMVKGLVSGAVKG